MKARISKRAAIARRIIGAVFAIGGTVLTAYVCYVWHQQGCEAFSLWAAIVMYGAGTFAMWFTIDQTIKEEAERRFYNRIKQRLTNH